MTTSPLLPASCRGASPPFIELSSERNDAACQVEPSNSQAPSKNQENLFSDGKPLLEREEARPLLDPRWVGAPSKQSSLNPTAYREDEHKSSNNESLQQKDGAKISSFEETPLSSSVAKPALAEGEDKKEVGVLFRELLGRDGDRSLFLTFASLCEKPDVVSAAVSAPEEIVALQTLGWIDRERQLCYKQEFDRLLTQHCENNLRTLAVQTDRERLAYVFNELMKGSSDPSYDWMGPKWRGPAWVSCLCPIRSMREREKNRVLTALKGSGLMNEKNQLITSSKIQAVLLEKFPGYAVCPLNQNSGSCFNVSLPTWQDLCNLIQDLIGLGRRSRS